MDKHIEKIRLPNGTIEVHYPVYKVLYQGRSRFQEIKIVSSIFGKMLILDDVIQLTTADEEIYHKGLVTPTFRKKFKKVLILGGGDGGAAKQLLKISDNIRIEVVDIDPMVTKVTKKYLPEVIEDVFERDNVKLVNMDASIYVRTTKDKYDMIIGDLTDIRYGDEEGSEVNKLYTIDFLNDIKKIMSKEGIVTYHIGGINTDREHVIDMYKSFKHVFPYVKVYGLHIPSFLDTWSYISGSFKKIRLNKKHVNVVDVSKLLNI